MFKFMNWVFLILFFGYRWFIVEAYAVIPFFMDIWHDKVSRNMGSERRAIMVTYEVKFYLCKVASCLLGGHSFSVDNTKWVLGCIVD